LREVLAQFKPSSFSRTFTAAPENVVVLAGVAVWGFWTGDVGQLILVAVAVMVLDFLTGVGAAFVSGIPSSQVALKGVVKKCMLATMVVLAALLDSALGGTGITIKDVAIGSYFPLTIAVSCWLIGVEGLSVLENINRAGLPTPRLLDKVFKKMREQGNPKKRKGEKDGRTNS
jgi:toxin secretion/phage lysis holin